MTWLEEAGGRYGPIAVGLAAGTAAKYARALNDGRPISRRQVIADLLRLGILGIVAATISGKLGLSGNWQALASAYLALGSDRLIQLIADRFDRRLVAMVDAMFGGRDGGA
ncbi:hypothetical protein [Sphingomonas sp.]|uniref:hypothetical protein n=1 Tax=Sphingomonas sp. TaxID=28214 RepID=UPI0025F0E25B|nr:hypothetical protein [Sphingomonas sp.]